MSRKRVVVTGLSVLTPLGNDLETSWKNLLDGKSGIGNITLFDTTEYDVHIAGELKDFKPENYGINVKQARRMDRFTQVGVAASQMLMKHSGFQVTDENAHDVSILLGIGLGGTHTIEAFNEKLIKSGPGRISPFYIPMLISNMCSGQIGIFTGARGSNIVSTSACASGTHALGSALAEIVLGRSVASISGGVEATVGPMAISGFAAMKALCTDYESPEKASRPFDKERAGFVTGEGAGMLMLEDLEHALARGADIYAELVGAGASCDAYHMTAPKEDGSGMALAMKNALRDAKLAPEAIDYVNAHGTSTYLNDLCETRAVKAVFGERAYKIPMSANKSQIGHLLGAAGGVEAVFSVMSLHTGILPGTINYQNPDPECDLDYLTDGSRKVDVEYVMSNSFGFGGTNGSVIFKRWSKK